MTVHNRKLKKILFSLAGSNFECQIQNWNMANNTDDGDKQYGFCGDGPDGEFREEADDDYALELTYWSDWRSGGLSDYLVLNDKAEVAFQLDHHPDIVGEHVRWSGTCILKAPSVGGEARTTEQQEITLQIKGKPTYARIG